MRHSIQFAPRSKRDRRSLRDMRKVWRNARPGMKVFYERYLLAPEGIVMPKWQRVYTIRELRRGLYRAWALGFTLREIVNEVDADQGSEPFFPADAFVLLTDKQAERIQQEIDEADSSFADLATDPALRLTTSASGT